jgi:membrane peptidoglycan carboxypeptidase
MDVGIDEMQKTAHRMGITDLREDNCGPPITLGSCEVKLVDMTYAFATLANNGVMKGRPSSENLPDGFRPLDPVSVLSIQDSHGNVVYQFSKPDEKAVEDPAHAYMVTDILSKDAVEWARLDIGRPAAAKTGTSEDFRDAVVMGYTPDLAVGTWIGNADNTPMAQGTFSSASVGPLWTSFMKQAHDYLKLPPKPFTVPDSIEQIKCAGKQELFVRATPPSKPGACSPKSASPTGTPGPTQGTVTPTPPRATETPGPETPTTTPSPSPKGTPGASTSPSPSGGPIDTPIFTAAPIPQQHQ